MEHITTLQESFASMLPAIAITLAACLAWLAFCRWLYRDEESAWKASIAAAPGDCDLPIDQQITLCMARLTVARSGSPADRLFFAGLAVVGGFTALVLMGYVLFK